VSRRALQDVFLADKADRAADAAWGEGRHDRFLSATRYQNRSAGRDVAKPTFYREGKQSCRGTMVESAPQHGLGRHASHAMPAVPAPVRPARRVGADGRHGVLRQLSALLDCGAGDAPRRCTRSRAASASRSQVSRVALTRPASVAHKTAGKRDHCFLLVRSKCCSAEAPSFV
jgi:hypothetical protein